MWADRVFKTGTFGRSVTPPLGVCSEALTSSANFTLSASSSGRAWLRNRCYFPILLRVIEMMNMVSMITLEEGRVYIQRDANTTVSELLLDLFRVGLSLNQESGKGVPEVMEPNLA
jgi:hypothetical protein